MEDDHRTRRSTTAIPLGRRLEPCRLADDRCASKIQAHKPASARTSLADNRTGIQRPRSSFHPGRHPFRARPRQRSVIDISRQSRSTDASLGNAVQATAVAAWLKPRCIYKTIIGWRLHARSLPYQRSEAKIACNVLNQMTSRGMPAAVRVV
jgi:hypothetical protein